jgi:hypothetical protein
MHRLLRRANLEDNDEPADARAEGSGGTMVNVTHLGAAERTARGRAARDRVSSSDHAGWTPAKERPEPVTLLVEQNATREADFVPVRHGRMMLSPFTFYRGAARIMAADLNGGTLARAHARSGDPVALASYLGGKAKFDKAITDLFDRYADQNEQDFQAFCEAVRSDRLEAVSGL